jgi:hypothetical protein
MLVLTSPAVAVAVALTVGDTLLTSGARSRSVSARAASTVRS